MGVIQVSHVTLRRGKPCVEKRVPAQAKALLGRSVFRRTFDSQVEAIQASRQLIPEWEAQIAAAMNADPAASQYLTKEVDRLRDRISYLEAELARAREGIVWSEKQLGQVAPKPLNAPTCGEVAEQFIQSRIRAGAWKKTEGRDATPVAFRRMLRLHAVPITSKPIAEVSAADIQAIMEAGAPEKLRPLLEQVWRYGKTLGYCAGENPASMDALSLPPPKRDKRHHPALDWRQCPEFMSRLRQIDSIPARALEFTVLTAARKGEVNGMQWGEVDMPGRIWTVPASRMKAGREHKVPLSDAAMAILEARKAAYRPRDNEFVFPSRKGQALSHNSQDAVLLSMKVGYSPHGFRSSFRNWAADHRKDGEVAEFCLSHTKTGTEGAYFRSTVLEHRRTLMQEWADFLE